MTDSQFIQARNDLIDLVIEIVKRVVQDDETKSQLIEELKTLKK